jgi:hypothetical protein
MKVAVQNAHPDRNPMISGDGAAGCSRMEAVRKLRRTQTRVASSGGAVWISVYEIFIGDMTVSKIALETIIPFYRSPGDRDG